MDEMYSNIIQVQSLHFILKSAKVFSYFSEFEVNVVNILLFRMCLHTLAIHLICFVKEHFIVSLICALQVKVGLLGTEESCSNAQAGSWSIKTHTVQAFNSWTARWPFVPMEIGNIPITVKLKSSKSSDTIRKALNVVVSTQSILLYYIEDLRLDYGGLGPIKENRYTSAAKNGI